MISQNASSHLVFQYLYFFLNSMYDKEHMLGNAGK